MLVLRLAGHDHNGLSVPLPPGKRIIHRVAIDQGRNSVLIARRSSIAR